MLLPYSILLAILETPHYSAQGGGGLSANLLDQLQRMKMINEQQQKPQQFQQHLHLQQQQQQQQQQVLLFILNTLLSLHALDRMHIKAASCKFDLLVLSKILV